MYQIIMFIRNFIPAGIKKRIHQTIYNRIQKGAEKRNAKLRFLNLGYTDDSADQLICPNEGFAANMSIQLYYQLLKEVNIENNDVVEVGCGAGGGCQLIDEHFKPKSITGVDLSNDLIRCNKDKYKSHKIKFIQGSAERLPFPENSVDVIVNLESSHCYPSRLDFIKEVKRILKPNGVFCYADTMNHKDMEKMEGHIKSNLQVELKRDISSNVIKALDKRSEQIKKMPRKNNHKFIPRVLQNIFFVTPHSGPYKALKSGEAKYVLFIAKNTITA